MKVKNYSSLTVLRLLKSNKGANCMELWDPADNAVINIKPENLSNLKEINSLIESIKNNIIDEPEPTKSYMNWIEKGWHKSIDYYVASRKIVKSEESSNTALNTTKSRIKTNISINKISNEQSTIPQALLKRRSKRIFSRKELINRDFYSALSAGISLINKDIEGFILYFAIYSVENIIPGIYQYDSMKNILILITEGIFREEMTDNIQGLRTPKTAAFTIILVADFNLLMTMRSYSKGLRDVYTEAGRLAQKILISFEQHGLSCLVTPALRDRPVVRLLKIEEPDFSPIYSLTIGYPIKESA